MNEGVTIRTQVETAIDNPDVARFTLQVVPMPTELVKELDTFIVEKLNEFFTEKGICNGAITKINEAKAH